MPIPQRATGSRRKREACTGPELSLASPVRCLRACLAQRNASLYETLARRHAEKRKALDRVDDPCWMKIIDRMDYPAIGNIPDFACRLWPQLLPAQGVVVKV